MNWETMDQLKHKIGCTTCRTFSQPCESAITTMKVDILHQNNSPTNRIERSRNTPFNNDALSVWYKNKKQCRRGRNWTTQVLKKSETTDCDPCVPVRVGLQSKPQSQSHELVSKIIINEMLMKPTQADTASSILPESPVTCGLGTWQTMSL